jgi:pimeloyl-ACP methyl ester carboxylesterase
VPFADVGDTTLYYETHGRAGDPAIVLVRGLGTQLIEWPRSLLEGLARDGLYVVTFDNRDAGLSSEVTADRTPAYRLEDMANDVVGLLDALSIERAHLFGISLGGMVAQHVAFAHPGRLASLISVMSTSGNPALPRPAPAIAARLTATAVGAEAIVAQNAEDRRAFGSPGYPESADVRLAAARAAYARSYRPAGVARQMQAAIADGSRVERLRTIGVPTLVIHGADDPLIPVEAGEDTARLVPGAKLVVVPGMGHNIPDALGGTIARVVTNFVAGLGQRLP